MTSGATPSIALLRSLDALRAQGIPFRKLADLRRREGNPRDNAEAVPAIVASLQTFGWTTPMIVDPRGELEAGDTRYLAAHHLGLAEVPVVQTEHDERTAKLYVPADNRLGEIAQWAPFKLADLFKDYTPAEIRLTGWEPADVQALLSGAKPNGGDPEGSRQTLAERFGVPPFSVLDARQGYWQNRKRAWVGLGLRSEVGRKNDLAFDLPEWALVNDTNTSVFDPVLTELLVRWYAPVGGRVLDPFAGGSVRGIVSAWLGRSYTGIELRPEQIAANRDQATMILAGRMAPVEVAHARPDEVSDPDAITPVQPVTLPDGSRAWAKRDDLFAVNGVTGAKARAGLALARETGAKGFVAAGSRHSPMVSRVARLAEAVGIPCRVYTARANTLSPAEKDAVAHGAELVRPPGRGFLNRLISLAEKDAAAAGWEMVRLGLDADCYVRTNVGQAVNVPAEAKRVVCPVGSGMGLASVLHGIDAIGRSDLPVVGVRVSDRDVDELLDRRAPPGWRERVTFVASGMSYETPAPTTEIDGVVCDSMYEAKCIPHLRAGDLLWMFARASEYGSTAKTHRAASAEWIEGDAQNVRALVGQRPPFDFLMTCPPYADLEVYSDDPRDLSTMPYAEFLAAYERIIAESVALLAEDAFAAVVVGEVRGNVKQGAYRGFVPDTIRAFEKAGMAYYNEAILVTAVGSLPVRTAGTFKASRKLGKTHQNVLVFVRGDVAKIVARLEETPAWDALGTDPAEPVLP